MIDYISCINININIYIDINRYIDIMLKYLILPTSLYMSEKENMYIESGL